MTADEEETVYRPLSNAERYHLSRHALGIQPVLSAFAEGRGTKDDVQSIHATLQNRVQHLIDSCPLLSIHIHGTQTLQPRLARRRNAVQLDEVLCPIEHVSSCTDLDFNVLAKRMEEDGMKRFDLTRAPLWRVRLLFHDPSSSFVVVLQIHHMIADGRGMMNLFQLLLLKHDATLPTQEQLQGSMTLQQDGQLPPSSDETMGTAVPLWWTVAAVSKALLLPHLPLPLFVRQKLGYGAKWPSAKHIRAKAIEQEQSWHHVEITSADTTLANEADDKVGLMARLKSEALRHEVSTLHPILHTAAMVAINRLLRAQQKQSDDNDEESCSFVVQSAASERDADKHGMVSGNYVASFSFVQALDEQCRLWERTRAYAQAITSPAGRLARSRTWSLMPDFLGALGERLRTPTPELPTTFEAFFHNQAHSANPFQYAVGLSNLGLLVNMDARIRRAAWVQITKPIGNVFGIDAMGWRTSDGQDGLSLFVGVRQGVVCSKEEEMIFVDALRATIVRFANGEIKEDDTFASILCA